MLARLVLLLPLALSCECTGDGLEPVRPAVEAVLDEPPEVLPDTEGCADGVRALPEHVQQGVCYAHNYQNDGERGYGSPTSRRSHTELVGLGVEWVSLTPFAFMRGADDQEVHLIRGESGGETDDRMARELAMCREAGVQVLLKPHIWIRGGAYRGSIEMRDAEGWDRWWESYERFLLHYAAMAQRSHVDLFTIGVELDHLTLRHEDRWRRLIARVREAYDGQLVYSANWDRAVDVPLWDAVDYIGVQFYPPLANDDNATDLQIAARLNTYMDVLERLSRRTRRHVLFTEVGYRSAAGAEVRPHLWPEREEAPDVSHGTQVRAYRLFFEALSERDWVAGTYVWKWFTDPEADEEGPAGFSPRRKPAVAVLRAAYAGECP